MNEFQALRLRDVPLDGAEGALLIGELQQEYLARYGGQDETPVDPRDFDPPTGGFLVAELAGELVGCGGLRWHALGIGELKRMYVRAGYRRRGRGRVLLTAIEQRAIALGYRQLILETGEEQPEALALYLETGYQPIANFGYYQDSGLAQSFAKRL